VIGLLKAVLDSAVDESQTRDLAEDIINARPRRLRSAETRAPLDSRTQTNFSDGAFNAVVPRVRNYLPTDLRQPFQIVAKDVFIWSVGPKRNVNAPLTAL